MSAKSAADDALKRAQQKFPKRTLYKGMGMRTGIVTGVLV